MITRSGVNQKTPIKRKCIGELLHDNSSPAGLHYWQFFGGKVNGTITGGTTAGVYGDNISITDNVSSGSNVYGMPDHTPNQGFVLQTSGSNDDSMTLNLNNNATYLPISSSGAVFISVARIMATADNNAVSDVYWDLGFKATTSTTAVVSCNHFFVDDDNYTKFRYRTTNSSQNENQIDTDVTVDGSWHVFRGENRSASCLGHMDGILRGVSTTNLPDSRQGFRSLLRARTGAVRKSGMIYLEVYNT